MRRSECKACALLCTTGVRTGSREGGYLVAAPGLEGLGAPGALPISASEDTRERWWRSSLCSATPCVTALSRAVRRDEALLSAWVARSAAAACSWRAEARRALMSCKCRAGWWDNQQEGMSCLRGIDGYVALGHLNYPELQRKLSTQC